MQKVLRFGGCAELLGEQSVLLPLQQLHIVQRGNQGRLCSQVDELLQTYNNFIMDTNAKFVGIDNELRKRGGCDAAHDRDNDNNLIHQNQFRRPPWNNRPIIILQNVVPLCSAALAPTTPPSIPVTLRATVRTPRKSGVCSGECRL